LFPKQFRIHAVLILAVLFMIFFPLINEKPDKEKAEKATAVAMDFLQLVDEGKYAESWQTAAKLMQEKVTQEEWVEKLTKARARSGALVNRTAQHTSYSTTAKDSPDGEYIMLTFESRYQHAESVDEYVTVMLEGEGWRVAGYFIQ
jgi:membrane-bound lytic murein transglycosylase